MSEWIRCSDRLPPVGAYVLAYWNGDMDVLKMETEPFDVASEDKPLFIPAEGEEEVPDVLESIYWLDGGECELEVEVTHWMPLPEPPKESEK
jgi:hypothetical protein